MLKTNTKKVINKVKVYILDHFKDFYYPDNKEYIEKEFITDGDIFKYILKTICEEKSNDVKRNYNYLTYTIFEDYCRGLPSILDCSYYYNISAIKLVGDWLEETEEERNRYTEQQAEEKATQLLYRVLMKYW